MTWRRALVLSLLIVYVAFAGTSVQLTSNLTATNGVFTNLQVANSTILQGDTKVLGGESELYNVSNLYTQLIINSKGEPGISFWEIDLANDCNSGDINLPLATLDQRRNAIKTGKDNNVICDYNTFQITYVSSEINITGFGFNIPSNAIIKGIEFAMLKKNRYVFLNNITDNTIMLLKNNLTYGNNYTKPDFWTTNYGYSAYGSKSDLWGGIWTPSDINNLTFGIQLKVNYSQNVLPLGAGIDFIRMNIYYTLPIGNFFVNVTSEFNNSVTINGNLTVTGMTTTINTTVTNINVTGIVNATQVWQAGTNLLSFIGTVQAQQQADNTTIGNRQITATFPITGGGNLQANRIIGFDNTSYSNLDTRQRLDNISLVSLIGTKENALTFNFPLSRSVNTISFTNTSYDNLDARQRLDNTSMINLIQRLNDTKVNLSGTNEGTILFTNVNVSEHRVSTLFINDIYGRTEVPFPQYNTINYNGANIVFNNVFGFPVFKMDLQNSVFNATATAYYSKVFNSKAIQIEKTFGTPQTAFKVDTASSPPRTSIGVDGTAATSFHVNGTTRLQTGSTTALQVTNATGYALLTADTTALNLEVNGTTKLLTNLTVRNQDKNGAFNISGITLFNESNRGWCVRVTGQGTLQAIEGSC